MDAEEARVLLERRLGSIEQVAALAALAVQNAAHLAETRHNTILEKIGDVKDDVGDVRADVARVDQKVDKQNGRVGKAEMAIDRLRTQWGMTTAILVGAAPFVFWALNRWT